MTNSRHLMDNKIKANFKSIIVPYGSGSDTIIVSLRTNGGKYFQLRVNHGGLSTLIAIIGLRLQESKMGQPTPQNLNSSVCYKSQFLNIPGSAILKIV